MFFNDFRENKILAKISESTVYGNLPKLSTKNLTETDEVCGALLPKLRAGSQSACGWAANSWEDER